MRSSTTAAAACTRPPAAPCAARATGLPHERRPAEPRLDLLPVRQAPLHRSSHALPQLDTRPVAELVARLVDRARDRLVHLAQHVHTLLVEARPLDRPVDD